MNTSPTMPDCNETANAVVIGSSAWFGADVTKPETFNSVIVWGLLEDEYHLDAHEGFWCGRNWWSVRQNETDPMAKKKLSGVTHWMPHPQSPNVRISHAEKNL